MFYPVELIEKVPNPIFSEFLISDPIDHRAKEAWDDVYQQKVDVAYLQTILWKQLD